jgi:ParB family chromosome partitioning protein
MATTQEDTTKVRWRKTDQLRQNPLNPRTSIRDEEIVGLACSIREQGILQPLLVTPDGTIVAGHRRHAAALKVGLERVPVVERPMDEREQLECMLIENTQREDLTPLDEARAYRELVRRGATVADIARRIGATTQTVTTRLAILDCSEEVRELFARGELPVGAAPALARLTDLAAQLYYASAVARRQLSVAKLAAEIGRSTKDRGARRADSRPPAATSRDVAVAHLEDTPRRLVSFEEVLAALEDVCCVCGMKGKAEVCGQCPLPRFVVAIAEGAERARKG